MRALPVASPTWAGAGEDLRHIPTDVSDIALHPNGSIWLSGAKGIRVITVAAGRAATSTWVTHGSCGTQILIDRDGGLWAGCFGGLVHHGKATDLLLPGAEALLKAQLMTTKDGMSSSILWLIREDRDGNIWVAGDGRRPVSQYKIHAVVWRNSTEDPPSSIVAGPTGRSGPRPSMKEFCDCRPRRSPSCYRPPNASKSSIIPRRVSSGPPESAAYGGRTIKDILLLSRSRRT